MVLTSFFNLLGVHNALSGFHLGNASGWDIFIVFILLIAVMIYGLFLGRNRMVILLLASYFSFIILQVLPWSRLGNIGWLGLNHSPSASAKILIFLGLILLFYFLIPRSALSSVLRIKRRGDASWLQLFILAIFQIGLIAAVIFSMLSEQTIEELAPLIKKIFTGSGPQFIWITLPILALVLLKKKKKIED